MKRFIRVLVFLVVVGIGLLALVARTPLPTTSWQAFEQQFPTALRHADFAMLSVVTEGSDQVPLPMDLRLRLALRPESRSMGSSGGFPESVQHYVVESIPTHGRLHCLIRYSGGKVACIVIRYPTGTQAEAQCLRDALRQTFQADRVSVEELSES